MRVKIPEILLKRPIYIQALFTFFAFLLMVVLSFYFTNKIVSNNLVRDVNSASEYAKSQITSELYESRTILDYYAQSLKTLILRGNDRAKLTSYNKNITGNLRLKENLSLCPNGPYSYIEKHAEGPFLLNGTGRQTPKGISIENQPWYKAALEANGGIAETAPYTDPATGEIILTYSICITDKNGARLGVAAIDIRTSHFGEKDAGSFNILPNGRRIGPLPHGKFYYREVYKMAFVLSVLGIALASILIIIFFRIDPAKNKSDMESKHKSAFFANMNHEIRNSLNAITGMTMIGKASNNIERKDYCFEKIQNASSHLLGVISDIPGM